MDWTTGLDYWTGLLDSPFRSVAPRASARTELARSQQEPGSDRVTRSQTRASLSLNFDLPSRYTYYIDRKYVHAASKPGYIHDKRNEFVV